MVSQIRTLLLYADYTTRLSYYDDWLDAFESAPQFEVGRLNICQRDAGDVLKRMVREVDLIVLLHSTNGDTTIYLEPFAQLLADRKGLLLSFVGNEVNLPGSPIGAKRGVLKAISPDYVATQLLLEAGEYLWGDLVRERVISVPHALNPVAFNPQKSSEQRPIDIGVRAVRYLPHLGDEDRNQLHDLFAHGDVASDLKIDISTSRLNREGWAAFLNDCKATVSSEAGSWFLERNDETIEAIRRWTAENYGGSGIVIANDSPFRKLGHKLPWWMRAFLRRVLSGGVVRHESTVTEKIPFDAIYERFFKDRQRPDFYGKCISSRHFDAAGTGTCQILVEGRYNDILKADEHFIPLKPDFSDVQDAVSKFKDVSYRDDMIRRTREYMLEEHTYKHRVTEITDIICK